MINACKIRGKPMNTKIPQSVIKIYANSFPLCQVPNFGSTELQKVSKIVIKSFCVILSPGEAKKGQKKSHFKLPLQSNTKARIISSMYVPGVPTILDSILAKNFIFFISLQFDDFFFCKNFKILILLGILKIFNKTCWDSL